MKIAVTGGIGAGKSFVCSELQRRGIDVYDCDAQAKRLMRTSATIQQQLKALVGNDVYVEGRLNKPMLAQFLLASDENAMAVDNIVHPAVAHDFTLSGYDWMECAILFDSHFNERVTLDKVVCVTAPLETRIKRIIKRDGISRSKALEWIGRQLPQDEVLSMSDYEIINDGVHDLSSQIDRLLKQIGS